VSSDVRFLHLVAVSCTRSEVGGTARTSKPVAPSGPSHRAITPGPLERHPDRYAIRQQLRTPAPLPNPLPEWRYLPKKPALLAGRGGTRSRLQRGSASRTRSPMACEIEDQSWDSSWSMRFWSSLTRVLSSSISWRTVSRRTISSTACIRASSLFTAAARA
jgi:hypothetical protein